MNKRRKALLAELTMAGREMSSVTIMFHTALSAKVGLTAIEEKTLDLLARSGPLTAKDLAERTHLTPASVTALVNRLERKQFVYRSENPRDRRSIHVNLRPESMKLIGSLFEDFARSLQELYGAYSERDLSLILTFMREIARRQALSTSKFGI